MSNAERQELYTLMGQWGRNPDILYQKVREWIEDKKAPEWVAEARLEAAEWVQLPEANGPISINKDWNIGHCRWCAARERHEAEVAALLAKWRRPCAAESLGFNNTAAQACRRCATELEALLRPQETQ